MRRLEGTANAPVQGHSTNVRLVRISDLTHNEAKVGNPLEPAVGSRQEALPRKQQYYVESSQVTGGTDARGDLCTVLD